MTPLVIRMMIISDALARSIICNRHSDDCNIFMIHASGNNIHSLNHLIFYYNCHHFAYFLLYFIKHNF